LLSLGVVILSNWLKQAVCEILIKIMMAVAFSISCFSLRSKRFQSSYGAKVRAGARTKQVEGGGGGEKRKRLPANPTILENAP